MTVKPTKEYFRKPYLVDDKAESEESEHSDYRYMMDTDWQGLQDSSYIVVQSVRKKPYAEDDYQDMEQKANGYTGIDWYLNWNWQRPKFNWGCTDSTIQSEFQPAAQTRTLTGKLSWIQCPTTVGVSKSYTIIVNNSYTSRRVYSGCRTQNNQVAYFPSSVYLGKKTANAKGLTITRVWQRNSVTCATLETSSTATGTYNVYASDGKNIIERTISVASIVYVNNVSGTVYDRYGDTKAGTFTNITTTSASKSTSSSLPSGYTLVSSQPPDPPTYDAYYVNYDLPFGKYSILLNTPAGETPQNPSGYYNNKDYFWVCKVHNYALGIDMYLFFDNSTNSGAATADSPISSFCN